MSRNHDGQLLPFSYQFFFSFPEENFEVDWLNWCGHAGSLKQEPPSQDSDSGAVMNNSSPGTYLESR